jgi:hypothetical protein
VAAKFKSFIVGLLLGSIVAFLLGMNYGRGAPLASNPFAARQITVPVKETTKELVQEAREKIHAATRPAAK